MSLAFDLFHAQLKETNEETDSVNMSEWRIIHKTQNSFPLQKKLNEILKIWNALFSMDGGSFMGGGRGNAKNQKTWNNFWCFKF